VVLLRTLSEAPQREALEGKMLDRDETGGELLITGREL